MPTDRDRLRQTLAEGASRLRIDLSARQVDCLLDYIALLAKWNAVYNLTAVRDPGQMVTQHLLDSLAMIPAVAGARHVLDVGSGGGLPGMVLAIWAQEQNRDMRVDMIDLVHKKTAFLTQAKAELRLPNVTVHTGRVEELQSETGFDVITSRAFAELADFVNWSAHLLAPGGRFVAMKGVVPETEIASLPSQWRVAETIPLSVPGLGAQRHLIVIQRETT